MLAAPTARPASLVPPSMHNWMFTTKVITPARTTPPAPATTTIGRRWAPPIANGGAGWTANLYNQVQTAVTNVGANTKLFTNEYNVLTSNGDNYGQWYSQHIESIRNGNGPNTGAVTGIGTEFYNTPGTTTSVGNNSHVNPARDYATWQNLAAQGLPLEVTEFGETTGTAADEATSLTAAMTLAFGTPQMTGFTLWGFYGYSGIYSGAAGSVLYNSSFQITAAGTAYETLLNSYTTDVTTTINADGSVTLPNGAFYGDYQVIVGGKSYGFTYDPSTNNYVVAVPEPSSLAIAVAGFTSVSLFRATQASSPIWRYPSCICTPAVANLQLPPTMAVPSLALQLINRESQTCVRGVLAARSAPPALMPPGRI